MCRTITLLLWSRILLSLVHGSTILLIATSGQYFVSHCLFGSVLKKCRTRRGSNDNRERRRLLANCLFRNFFLGLICRTEGDGLDINDDHAVFNDVHFACLVCRNVVVKVGLNELMCSQAKYRIRRYVLSSRPVLYFEFKLQDTEALASRSRKKLLWVKHLFQRLMVGFEDECTSFDIGAE